MDEEEKLFTIMLGNPVSGVRLFGIFEDAPDAVEAAEKEFPSEEWNIIPIHNV